MYKQKLLIMMTTTALALSACATIEEKLAESGATRLNANQVKTLIVGNTEKWTKGGGYYNPNGTIETLWEGSTQSGSYSIAADGNVCFEIADWGKTCYFYMNDGGTIIAIHNNKNMGPRDVLAGNQLSTL